MAALALKAVDYGADKIPDSFFEAIPGGFFKPQEKKRSKSNRKPAPEPRNRSERRTKERSRRYHNTSTDYSDYSGHDDSDNERDYRDNRGGRRRAKSVGQNPSHNMSRGRHTQRTSEWDGPDDFAPMDRAERGSQFPPPLNAGYAPYNPNDYATGAAVAAATGPAMAAGYHDPSAGYHEPPYSHPSLSRQDYGYPAQPLDARPSVSSSAARYTPVGYAPSPVNVPPLPTTAGYAPYNPADYASSGPSTTALQTYPSPPPTGAPHPAQGNGYAPPPPPFYRQQSRSQPSLAPLPHPDDRDQLNHLELPPSRQGSTSSSRHHRHRDGKHHRTRSAGNHGRSRSRVTDQLRDRFESLDTRERGLAASVGGALAGGLAGNAVGKGKLSTLVGAAIGSLGGREFEKRHDKKRATHGVPRSREGRHSSSRRDYSRSPSRDRRRGDRHANYDDYDSFSDSDSDRGSRAARRRRSTRRRDEEI